jgi:hypothetical protein
MRVNFAQLETKYAAEMAQLEEQKRMYQEKIAALRYS